MDVAQAQQTSPMHAPVEPAVPGLAERGRHHVGHQQRPGSGMTAELVGHQAQVDETLVTDGAPAVAPR